MFHRAPDGTVTDEDGKVIYFSCERFIRDICEGNCCFICGIHPEHAEFNNEHVLPDWLLRQYGLHDRRLNLPNGTTFRYDQYTIPCCASCNFIMGREVEEPVRNLIAEGSKAINEHLRRHESHTRLLLTVWLALIFLKTHLKDKTLRFHRDFRQSDDPISNLYTWEELHHIHCLARSFYTGVDLSIWVLGSFAVLPVRQEGTDEIFDWIDLTHHQTMLLRLSDIAFLTVFNDSGGSLIVARPLMERLADALSPIQLRELTAELAFLNFHILERPRYRSEFDLKARLHRMVADLPSAGVVLRDIDRRLRGRLMYHLFREMLPSMQLKNYTHEEAVKLIQSGSFSFLFDDSGAFITQSFLGRDS